MDNKGQHLLNSNTYSEALEDELFTVRYFLASKKDYLSRDQIRILNKRAKNLAHLLKPYKRTLR